MSQGQRIPLEDARALAKRFEKLMLMACESVEVAGSIRRRKPTVGDIEVVVVPQTRPVEVRKDLFTWETVQECKLSQMIEHLASKGVFTPRLNKHAKNIAWNLDGSARYLAGIYHNFAVDVFIVREDRKDWHGWTMVLRTGPGDANQWLVTPKRKGGGLPGNILLQDGMVRNGIGWLPLPTEADVFEAWNMDYVEPWDRTILNYRKALKTKTTG